MNIHFIAIGGAAMHQLAIALYLNGHNVSGSDDEIFDPALSNLRKYNLIGEKYYWNINNISNKIDLVILGMHARIDNPELLEAQKLGIKIVSFPEFVYLQSKAKKRVVISGSHGKTTITSMIMHVLKCSNISFDYLVGSKVIGFDIMVSLSEKNNLIVIEGDEYLSSCLDPNPKFYHYHPHIAVVSGIEWDHINVFPKFENYLKAFETFIDFIEDNGSIIYFKDDKNINNLIKQYKGNAEIVPYKAFEFASAGDVCEFYFQNNVYKTNIFGEHNFQNMSAAYEVCKRIGISDSDFFNAISSFGGAAKRLEKVFSAEGVRIFRDFAHAPSKLKATVKAVKNQFPDEQLVAVFELHTFSSMNKNFLPHYSGCLDIADIAIVYFSHHAFCLKKLKQFSKEEISNGFSNKNIEVFCDAEELLSYISINAEKPTNVLLMSSGNFDNINFDKIFSNINKKN